MGKYLTIKKVLCCFEVITYPLERKSATVLQLKLPAAFEMQQASCTCCPSHVICAIQRKSSCGSIYKHLCKHTGSWNPWSNTTPENLKESETYKTMPNYSLKAIKLRHQGTILGCSCPKCSKPCWGSAGRRRWGWQVWGHASPVWWSSGCGAASHHGKYHSTGNDSLGLKSTAGNARPGQNILEVWGPFLHSSLFKPNSFTFCANITIYCNEIS